MSLKVYHVDGLTTDVDYKKGKNNMGDFFFEGPFNGLLLFKKRDFLVLFCLFVSWKFLLLPDARIRYAKWETGHLSSIFWEKATKKNSE